MATETDEWEYLTYAPPGHKCSVCLRDVEPLDPVRRGTVGRGSSPLVVVYRHAGECPGRTVGAA